VDRRDRRGNRGALHPPPVRPLCVSQRHDQAFMRRDRVLQRYPGTCSRTPPPSTQGGFRRLHLHGLRRNVERDGGTPQGLPAQVAAVADRKRVTGCSPSTRLPLGQWRSARSINA
jgi:hypothetical protein